MEQPEVPLEQVQEDINHHHEHHEAHADHGWSRWVALTTAMIAALAALASLAAGHTETEVMQAKMSANDRWNYMQGVSLKKHAVEDTVLIISAMGKTAPASYAASKAKYDGQEDAQKQLASDYEKASESFLQAHEHYSYGVTMFQVAIALSAIAALTRRRLYWLLSMGLGAVGVVFACWGLQIQTAIIEPKEAAEAAPAAVPAATPAATSPTPG